jgi:predicted nuclease of predicted toxin-antitoxin system
VKFLVDRCAGRRVADWLREQGHDVVESRERGSDPCDQVILSWASSEDRILVTMDKDYGEFIFRQGSSHRGLVRLPEVPADKRIELIAQVLKSHSQDLKRGSIVTVRGDRIRTSLPPR